MLVGMIVMTLIIVSRLAHLQIINHDHYTTLSHENRLKIVPIPSTRGLIFSREGVLLADNQPAFSLEVVPERIVDLEQALRQVKQIVELDDDRIDDFRRELKRARRFEAVSLKTGLSSEQVARFSVNRHHFPGFEITARLNRYYPLGERTAHVVGYVGRISENEIPAIDTAAYIATTHIGKVGVENAREAMLHGKVGFQQVEVNAQGRILRVVERTPPIAGSDIYLTLDASLQEVAYDALAGHNGAIVVLDTESGGILAFVSNPSFDPNDFVSGISRQMYKRLRESRDRPLFNRALQGQYPPGSTIKPFMALAGLEKGVRKPHDDTWCPGWFTLPGGTHRYRDWLKQGHGRVDLRRSIVESCDVYFYALARDLGINAMYGVLKSFGFGNRTGVDLPGESDGLLPSPEWKRRTRNLPWYQGETLITGIGQGFMLVSPLQLASVVSIIANRGRVRVPHVLGQIEDTLTHKAVEPEIPERPRIKLNDRDNWDRVIDGMVGVVHDPRGTARRSGAGAAFQFAGKTGTAQVFGLKQDQELDKNDTEELPEHLRDHALFIAFAPVDRPQIAVAVVVEHGGSGSRTAAPIARLILDHYLRPQEAPVAQPDG